MNERELKKSLSDLPLKDIRYFDRTGSTNDAALAWAAEDAPDLALVCADEQTSGRGRSGRRWFTPPGAALAFSLILGVRPGEEGLLSRFTALGALAVCEALDGRRLPAEIKWPNDVLVSRRKVCGVLAEAVWMGERVDRVVVGVGINVTAEAVPPAESLNFPATCIECEAPPGEAGEAPEAVDRLALLHEVLAALLHWRERIAGEDFLHAWEDRLAFHGEAVEIWGMKDETLTGRIEGLDGDGGLRLRSSDGQAFTVQFGEVHLRPLETEAGEEG